MGKQFLEFALAKFYKFIKDGLLSQSYDALRNPILICAFIYSFPRGMSLTPHGLVARKRAARLCT
jgi:hypothetical protein